MRGRAISVALALALTLVATLAAGQAHGGKSAFALRSAKQHDGPYKVFTRVAIEQGDQRTTWWRVKNKSATDEESMNFSDLGGDAPGYKVQWFRGQENISAEVVDAMSPSNFPLMNPVVLERTVETHGENLVARDRQQLNDIERAS